MIEQTTIEGIRTLLAPGPGPTRGGVTFRVGQADETLSTAGITHLVEHLALHKLGMTDYHFNGATGPIQFTKEGRVSSTAYDIWQVKPDGTSAPFKTITFKP